MSDPIPVTIDGITYPSKMAAKAARRGMTKKTGRPARYDAAEFRRLVASGMGTDAIAKQLGIHENTVRHRCKSLRIASPGTQGQEPPQVHPTPPPTRHLSAVTMPDEPVQARADYPDLLAAIMRAKGTATPQTTLAMIATRFRLPVAQVQGMARRVWA